ncbi:MFS transporter, partial [Dickeya dianthicola]|nr:MFS transporter [Dickeya dianthicola]
RLLGQTTPPEVHNWVTFWWIPAVMAAVIAFIFLISFKYQEQDNR